jgi:hypothetical protein
LHDERWLKPVEQIYQRLARWEKYLRNETPLARVGLVYSQQTGWFVGGRVEDHINGWYQALIEARIPFEMVHDRMLAEALVKLKAALQMIHPSPLEGERETERRRSRDSARSSCRTLRHCRMNNAINSAHSCRAAVVLSPRMTPVFATKTECDERILGWRICSVWISPEGLSRECRTLTCGSNMRRRRIIRCCADWKMRRGLFTEHRALK